MGSHQLLSTTAQQKQIERHLHDLVSEVLRERDPRLAQTLRSRVNQLHEQWAMLQKSVDLETFESEPASRMRPEALEHAAA
jgi:hypothetical protein